MKIIIIIIRVEITNIIIKIIVTVVYKAYISIKIYINCMTLIIKKKKKRKTEIHNTAAKLLLQFANILEQQRKPLLQPA